MCGGRLSFQLFAHQAGTGSTLDTWVISVHQIIIVSIIIVLTYKNITYSRPPLPPFYLPGSPLLLIFPFFLSQFSWSSYLTPLTYLLHSHSFTSIFKGIFFFFLMFLAVLSCHDLHHWSPNFFGCVFLWVKCFGTYIFVIYIKSCKHYEQMWYAFYIYMRVYVYKCKHQLCNILSNTWCTLWTTVG